MPNFRLLRFLRRRMTIAAPRMAVRTHVPWYWRWLFLISAISISAVFALFIYDAGRRFAGFDSDEVRREVTDLRAKSAQLTQENTRLGAEHNAAGSKIAIEQTTLKNLATQVQALEAENTRLKEDLALFEGMVASERKEGTMAISGAKVRVADGQLMFRMLLARGARTGSIMGNNQEPEFAGRLEFQLELGTASNGATLRLPSGTDADAIRVRFRYFQRVEGGVVLPAGVNPRQVLVRLMEGDKLRASQTVTVDAATAGSTQPRSPPAPPAPPSR